MQGLRCDELHLDAGMEDFAAALKFFGSQPAEPSNDDLGIPDSVTRGPAPQWSNFNPIPYSWENLIDRVPDLAPGYAYLLFLDGIPAMTYTFFDVVHVSIIEYQRQGKNVPAVQILHNPT